MWCQADDNSDNNGAGDINISYPHSCNNGACINDHDHDDYYHDHDHDHNNNNRGIRSMRLAPRRLYVRSDASMCD